MVNNTGSMIATIRQLKRISQVDLADKSGVPASYISRFEAGRFVLSEKHYAALERALGVSFDAIKPAFQSFARAVLANDHQPTSDGNRAA